MDRHITCALFEGPINLRTSLLAECQIATVSHHRNNLRPWLGTPRRRGTPHTLAQRAVAWKKAASERFIHNGGPRFALPICFGKFTPNPKRNAHNTEVIG